MRIRLPPRDRRRPGRGHRARGAEVGALGRGHVVGPAGAPELGLLRAQRAARRGGMELRKHLQRARHQRARRTQRGVQHLHHGGAHRRRAARLGREHGQAAGRSVRAGRPAVLRLERGGHLFRCARARDPLEPRLRALLAAVAGHVRLGVAELHQPQAHRRDGLDVRGHARVRGEVLPAVTGRDLSYEESIELGHKFWVLDRAIWALEGRHRDQECSRTTCTT